MSDLRKEPRQKPREVDKYHRSPGVYHHMTDDDDTESDTGGDSEDDSTDDDSTDSRGCPECNDDIDFTDIEDELPYECDNCPAFFAEISQRK
jgi:predicted  nucleic acid-binding Zn ribbon protein